MPAVRRDSTNSKDLVYYASKFGGFFKGLFSEKKSSGTFIVGDKINALVITNPVQGDTAVAADSSFGNVYGNKLAEKGLPTDKYEVGAIFVREKLESKESTSPSKVIAMVKREKGFSKETGDWEFFAFDGDVGRLEVRETVGNCATCHANASRTDWVFNENLK